MPVEHEVKLEYADVEAARQAVTTAGGRLDVARRLLDDELLDTPEGALRARKCALRIRRDGSRAIITFKGPPQAGGVVKSREELETPVEDGETMRALLHALGYRAWFRSQKYREEFLVDGARVTIDETPMGVFIEIEASPDVIPVVAGRLGREPVDFIVESYPRLHRRWCEERGLPPGDMTFAAGGPGRNPGAA